MVVVVHQDETVHQELQKTREEKMVLINKNNNNNHFLPNSAEAKEAHIAEKGCAIHIATYPMPPQRILVVLTA